MRNRGKLVNFMVSDEERKRIQLEADKKGYKSTADFIRTLIMDNIDNAKIKQYKLFK